ncbi:hypothetical protein N2152v2_003315 [Parachlorella kessleri]
MSRPVLDLEHETLNKATSAVTVLEQSLVEVANQPTVGQYYVRSGSYAGRGGLEFSAMLVSSLSPPALDRLQQMLADAQATAKAIQAVQRQEQEVAAAEAAAAGRGGRIAGATTALRRVWSRRPDSD